MATHDGVTTVELGSGYRSDPFFYERIKKSFQINGGFLLIGRVKGTIMGGRSVASLGV